MSSSAQKSLRQTLLHPWYSSIAGASSKAGHCLAKPNSPPLLESWSLTSTGTGTKTSFSARTSSESRPAPRVRMPGADCG